MNDTLPPYFSESSQGFSLSLFFLTFQRSAFIYLKGLGKGEKKL